MDFLLFHIYGTIVKSYSGRSALLPMNNLLSLDYIFILSKIVENAAKMMATADKKHCGEFAEVFV